MIVVDVETTGLDIADCSLLSIGALSFDEPENTFYGECRMRPGALIQNEVPEITGFSFEDMADPSKPTVKVLMGKFIKWMEQFPDRTLAGASVGFDFAMLEAEAVRTGHGKPFHYRTVDLHSLAYVKYLQIHGEPLIKDGRSRLGLKGSVEFVGMEDPREVHNALVDAKLTAEALSRIIYGKKLLPEFSNFPVPDYLKK